MELVSWGGANAGMFEGLYATELFQNAIVWNIWKNILSVVSDVNIILTILLLLTIMLAIAYVSIYFLCIPIGILIDCWIY